MSRTSPTSIITTTKQIISPNLNLAPQTVMHNFTVYHTYDSPLQIQNGSILANNPKIRHTNPKRIPPSTDQLTR